ncbi:hypothetical protein [Streptomyces sp. NPDC005438]|uniref:hypothetical protein n=1 Tax=Streptomyces sp. NPDC005438 TaxID=3156880 RepID=UPI0033B09089
MTRLPRRSHGPTPRLLDTGPPPFAGHHAARGAVAAGFPPIVLSDLFGIAVSVAVNTPVE